LFTYICAGVSQVSPQAMQIAADYEQRGGVGNRGHDAGASNIQQLLTCGTIDVRHLQQVELIGSGNGGHVYKYETPSLLSPLMCSFLCR